MRFAPRIMNLKAQKIAFNIEYLERHPDYSSKGPFLIRLILLAKS